MHSNRRIYAAIVPRALVISTGLGSEPAFVSSATSGTGNEVSFTRLFDCTHLDELPKRSNDDHYGRAAFDAASTIIR